MGRRAGLGRAAARPASSCACARALLLVLSLAVHRASPQSCDSPALQEWCWERCVALQGWLRLRFSYDFFDDAFFQESAAVSVLEMCPQARLSFFFTRSAAELQKSPRPAAARVRGLINEGETLLRTLLAGGFNISQYFAPTTLSFAPFFHISKFAEALREYPDVIGPVEQDCTQLPEEGLHRTDRLFPALHLNLLREYLDSDEVPPGAAVRLKLTEVRLTALRDECSVAASALLFAFADAERLKLRTNHFQWYGTRVQHLIRIAAECLFCAVHHQGPPGLIAHVAKGCVPLFDAMDRLDRQVVVPLVLEEAADWEGRTFLAHVLPTPNIEASHSRGLLKLHCDAKFQHFAQERRSASAAGSPFFMMEVGAHLGGCIFHAMTHLDPGVHGLAVEPYAPAAAAMRRTVAANRLAGRMAVEERLICEEEGKVYMHQRQLTDNAPWIHQPEWIAGSGGAAVGGGEALPDGGGGDAPAPDDRRQCVRLDALLRKRSITRVDLLRVHVLGSELPVLRTLAPLLRAGMLGSVAVAIFSDGMPAADRQDAVGIARLLRVHGFSLTYEGMTDAAAVEAALVVGGRRPEGTSTLLAVLEEER